MRAVDFLQYSVSPWMRCVACVILGGALCLLYRWDPERRAKKQRADTAHAEIPVEPQVSKSALNSLSGDGMGQSETLVTTHSTVVELEQYLKDLRRHRIPSVDSV